MKEVIDYYYGFDEWGRLEREPLEFLVNWHYMKEHLPLHGHILDSDAGLGKYALELAKHGYTVTLSELTPRLVEMAKDKAAEAGLSEQFAGFHVLNAIYLEGLADETFDASLMMGPLYHLQNEEERGSAVKGQTTILEGPGGRS